MAGRIVLVSEDSNFFEFIRTKLELRKSDELFLFSFEQIKNKFELFKSGVIIINSEDNQDKTLNLIKLLKKLPTIIITFNEDETFKKKCYRAGAFDYIPLLTSDSEFRARMIPALSVATLLEKNIQYRNLLVNNNIIDSKKEVYTAYNEILDYYLSEIQSQSLNAVLGAIASNNNISENQIQEVISNNLRRNDVLMTYAPNKYFLLLFNINTETAEKTWNKIIKGTNIPIFAGFSQITNQTRQQLINEVLNKLHIAINHKKNVISKEQNPLINLSGIQNESTSQYNFKLFKQEFIKNIEKIITPAFYNIQLKYSAKNIAISTNNPAKDTYWEFAIKGKNSTSVLKITTPGYTKINIDIECIKNEHKDSKRITLEPNEFELGLLEDILNQFVLEYKNI